MTKKILNHFEKVDIILFNASKKYGNFEIITPKEPKEYFVSLCDEIVSQQLSRKVADVIFDRFKKIFTNGKITAEHVLKLKHEDLRATGMSNSKVKFIMDLASRVYNREVDLEKLVLLENDKVVTELTKIKGIGPWTAEMFLMFTLGREDVFSHGDLGLRNAIKKLYVLDNPTKEYVGELSLKWSPYRTYACRILWNSLEN
ncbi:MAG: hypothetical protein A2687_00275 [Candidatus Levybacteria bacterium RIFCSPHIGHO2_01_FULL_38_26]|nr:MAG: hypothetical protein A2687_00275 [Candidatus Levybacteria bacterium RIFCSPHIGHO2_01_FULL_38_26]